MKTARLILITIFAISSFTVTTFLFKNNGVEAAELCKASDCLDGWYVCSHGTRCCQGGGCPSYDCSKDEYTRITKEGDTTTTETKSCRSVIGKDDYTCVCTVRTTTKTKEPYPEEYYCAEGCGYKRTGSQTCKSNFVRTSCKKWGESCFNTTYVCGSTYVCPCRYCCYWQEKKCTNRVCYSTGCIDWYGFWKTECTDDLVWRCDPCSKMTTRTTSTTYLGPETYATYTSRGKCVYCAPSGGGGGTGGSVAGCSVAPTAPTLVSPNQSSVISDNLDVNFSWQAPSSWGANCNAGRVYRLMVDDESSFSSPTVHSQVYTDATTAQELELPGSDTYHWRVQACNSFGCTNSATWSFDLTCGSNPSDIYSPSPSDEEEDVEMPVTVSWQGPDDWGNACGGSNNNTYSVFARVKTGGSCHAPNPADYTEVCDDIASSSCDTNFFSVRNTDFCWYVEANNGTNSTLSASNGSEVWEFRTEDPLKYQNWVTAIGGDVYMGEYSAEFPNSSSYVAPWSPPYTVFENPDNPERASMVASNDIYITHDNNSLDYNPEVESGLYAKAANFKRSWPPNFRGTPPASAIEITSSCGDIFDDGVLNPYSTYEADVECVQDAIDAVAGDSYDIANDGYAVLFVTGSGDLDFEDDFKSVSDDKRVIFVTGKDISVFISRDIGLSGNPSDLDPEAQIEAAFIVTKDIEFDGVASSTSGDPVTDPDTTIVVEGPIVAKNASFNRNRGLDNSYPSEIVKYNSNYIYNLTEEERRSTKSTSAGLFVIDIDWIEER